MLSPYFIIHYGVQSNLSGYPPPTEIRRRESALDRLYIYNRANADVYQKMKVDMPLLDLFSLYDQYACLYRKIASQSEKERDYDTDISFDTPFLMPW